MIAAGSPLDPLYEVMGQLLALFYGAVPSYGVAIILLTVAVRLVLFPLTTKQARSMQAMQRLQPEMKRLQAKYKNDRQKLNEEMMKFYKEHKVNPLAGCLPLLLQMPLFIVLYRIISDLTKTAFVGALIAGGVASNDTLAGFEVVNEKVSGGEIVAGSISGASVSGDVRVDDRIVGKLSGAKVTRGRVHGAKAGDPAAVVDSEGERVGTIRGLAIENGHLEARPKHIPKDSDLHKALSKTPGEMESWGIDLADRPTDAGEKGMGGAWPYYLLVLLVVGTGYYQQKQMTARTPASAQNPQAQMMGRIFPVFFGLISLSIPAGVVVYFIASNIWQIGQQAWIFRDHEATPTAGSALASGDGERGNSPKDPVRDADATEAPRPPKPQPQGSGRSRNRKRRKRR